MVTIYSQLLAKRYQGRLDGEADEMLSTVLDGAKRMQNLIRSLLDYALSGQEQRAIPTSIKQALETALENLKASLKESGANLTYEDLPTVLAHPTQLAQVFQNLVGNALKYRQPQRPLEIQVTAQPIPGAWVISIRDNGMGFDPEQAKTVFEPFRRLQLSAQPGTGLGLAICQRMVQRWGGAIWAESQPDRGSVFYIRLQDGEGHGESAGAGG